MKQCLRQWIPFSSNPGRGLQWFIAVYCLTFIACETEFLPRDINLEPEYVVEGYLELGEQALPPYVILTQSKSFFSSLPINELENLFVHNAVITVSEGAQQVKLTELCLNDLPLPIKKLAADRLGLNLDSLKINFCVYIDVNGQIKAEEGKTYKLDIQHNNHSIQAETTIAGYVPLDSLWWRDAPGKPVDTLLQLMTRIKDPVGKKNFYRYSCSINGSAFITPFSSVNDDALIDGKDFEFRLLKPNFPGEDFDQSNFGLFHTGDSVAIKWSAIDEAHFNFWNTLEFNQGNQGPFSSYTTVDSNIKGGLGIWGSYNSRVYRIKVEK